MLGAPHVPPRQADGVKNSTQHVPDNRRIQHRLDDMPLHVGARARATLVTLAPLSLQSAGLILAVPAAPEAPDFVAETDLHSPQNVGLCKCSCGVY